MSLIFCPECQNKISDRAEACPHCGLPAKYFDAAVAVDDAKTETRVSQPLDLTALRNILIAFDHAGKITCANRTSHEISWCG